MKKKCQVICLWRPQCTKYFAQICRPTKSISMSEFESDELLSFEPCSCSEVTQKATEIIIKTLTSTNSRLRPRYDRYDVAVSFRPCSDYTQETNESLESINMQDLNIGSRIYRTPRVSPTTSRGWRDSAAAVLETRRCEIYTTSKEKTMLSDCPALQTDQQNNNSHFEDLHLSTADKVEAALQRFAADRTTSTESKNDAASPLPHILPSGCADNTRYQVQYSHCARLVKPAISARPRRLWARLLGCLGAH